MDTLKVFFVAFSIHKEKQFECSAGYIFASDQDRVVEALRSQYGPLTTVRVIEEVPIEEGTILYGKQWRKIR